MLVKSFEIVASPSLVREQRDRMKRTDRPTLRTVADLSGLAVATVSRALANDPKIAQSTRERVAAVAASLGYVPDRAARRLRTGRTMVVNLILDPHFEILGFGNALLVGLTTALDGSGYNLVVTPHFSDEDSLAPIRHLVANRQADGVIFTRTAPFDDRVRFLLEHDFPFVCHGRTEFSEPHAWVDYDNEAFAFVAAMRLVEKGCRKICAILPPETLTFHQHLRYGLMRAVRATGVEFHIPSEVTLESPMEDISAWAAAMSQTRACPDGFVCPGEASYLAIRGAFAAREKRPGAGFHAVAKSISGVLSQIDPQTDMIHENVETAGRLMAQHLLTRMGEPDVPPPQVVLPAELHFSD